MSLRRCFRAIPALCAVVILSVGACSSDDPATPDGTSTTLADGAAPGPLGDGAAAGDGGGSASGDGASSPSDASAQLTFDGGKVVACSGVPDSGGVTFLQVCGLKMPLSGAVSATLDTSGCGRNAPDTFVWQGTTKGVQLTVTMQLAAALAVDTVGVFPLKSLELKAPADAGGSVWTSPSGACSIAVDLSECKPTKSHPTQRIISGRGACAQPLTSTSGAPVDVAPFTFLVAFDP